MRPLARARGGRQPRPSRPARPRSSISLESSAPNSWTAGFALSPGPTDTAMFGRFPGEEQGEAVKDVLRTNNPSKRMADPLEIAKLAVYLASDDSAYVVGADFLIDGGVTAISAVGA